MPVVEVSQVSRSERSRVALGVPLSVQVAAVVLAALLLTVLVAAAVLEWLERSA